MSKLVAIMSMSLDGFVADRNDGVGEVFDWYTNSGDVEFHTGGSDPMTFRVSPPSAVHLRSAWVEFGALLSGRRTSILRKGGTAITGGDLHSCLRTRCRKDGPGPTRASTSSLTASKAP